MLSKNKEYVVDIVDIGQGGVGIGKYEEILEYVFHISLTKNFTLFLSSLLNLLKYCVR